MHKESKEILLRIPGETNFLDKIRSFIAGIALEAGFDDEELYNIATAVDEACMNIIEHAYDKDEEAKPIAISLEVSPSKLIISITDYGKGFNLATAVKPLDISKLVAEKRDGGLGLFLIRSLMDEINYTSEPGQYNKLTMIKYIKP